MPVQDELKPPPPPMPEIRIYENERPDGWVPLHRRIVRFLFRR